GFANDVNNNGQIVGQATDLAGDYRAFIITPQSNAWVRDMNMDGANDLMVELTFGGNYGEATGINDKGQVVGEAELPAGYTVPFLYRPDPDYGLPAGMHDLETLYSAYGRPIAINDGGQILFNEMVLTPDG